MGKLFYGIMAAMLLAACSQTRNVPEGDQLYVGMKKIEYNNYEPSSQATNTQTEVEAALAMTPNGALLGSPYYRSPIQTGLWIWNAFSRDSSAFSRWMCKTFGREPILMSNVNPRLRASVAENVLHNHGYFSGKVDFDNITISEKKAKIKYSVNMGALTTIDTLTYERFPKECDSLIAATLNEARIKSGAPFDVSNLEAERNRISTLLRNNGYYYYQPSYASYLADTITTPHKATMKFQMASDVDARARRKWYIGNINVEFRKQFMDSLDNAMHFRHLHLRFNGRRPPIRAGVILRDLELRPRQLFSYEKYQQSASQLSAQGIYSYVNFNFTPRDTTAENDTLDLNLSCVLDKPYQLYVETNAKGKTTGRWGPQLIVGLSKMNAFHGGEKIDINLHGSYEWQTGHKTSGSKGNLNSYEYGGDISLSIPRLLLPFVKKRRRYFATPTTVLKASSDIINRADFFKRHIVSGELTYNFQPTPNSHHSFSPLILEYDYMKNATDSFKTILEENPYLKMSMQDELIPKMSYTYTYTSPRNYLSPIYWRTTISESGNVLALGYMATGKKWSEGNKEMFENPFAQFIKIETDYRKTWTFGGHTQLVGHIAAGVIYAYGNSERAPYSEQFYVGGANSIRAFAVRSIGPGGYHTDKPKYSYVDQTGDLKFVCNLEYRARLFGNLYGATFIDAGNVWALKDDYRENAKLKAGKLFKQMAVGTGVGLRYDLDFFVLRLDWGIGLHAPYDGEKRGWYNMPNFRKSQSLNLAIGYPF